MNHRIHQLSALGVCLTLAACSSWFKPAKLPAAPAMSEMQTQPGAEIDTQWWTLFNDAELNRLMGVGAHKARATAAQTLAHVYQRVGFVPIDGQ